MLYDLRLGIINWSQNKKNCYNYRYLQFPIKTEYEYVKGYYASV